MKIHTKNTRVADIPAGMYYVGDPCYVFEDGDDWDVILDASSDFTTPMIKHMGHAVGAFDTAYGDGCYTGAAPDEREFEFPVDSGLVGFVAIGLLKPAFVAELQTGDEKCGMLVNFAEPWTASSWDDGIVRIGHIFIDTTRNNEGVEWEQSSGCEYPEQ